jgi:hypothetical protein
LTTNCFSELTKVRVLPMSDDDYSEESDTDVFLKKPSFVGEDWSLCTKCESFRPPRAHHCRICRRCIRKMDHHCKFFQKFNQNLSSKISEPFLTQKINFFLHFELKNSFWNHFLSQKLIFLGPWVNNCVGEFNQKHFLQFIFYVGILSAYAIG